MTCNNVHVPEALFTGLWVAAVVAAALAGEAVVIAGLLARRRVALGWVFALAMTLVVAAWCVWQIADMWALRAGLEAGTAGGKGVCFGFFAQRQTLAVCAVFAGALAVAIGARVWWGSRDRRAASHV